MGEHIKLSSRMKSAVSTLVRASSFFLGERIKNANCSRFGYGKLEENTLARNTGNLFCWAAPQQAG